MKAIYADMTQNMTEKKPMRVFRYHLLCRKLSVDFLKKKSRKIREREKK